MINNQKAATVPTGQGKIATRSQGKVFMSKKQIIPIAPSHPPDMRHEHRTKSTKPTLKTIAELSGLAVPTVSRALKDAPVISQYTKRRVREVADKIGYVPHHAGVRLRTGRTFVISLVLSTRNEMMNHTARLMSAIVKVLRNTPYHLVITPFFPDEDPMKPVRYLVENGAADAMILNETTPDDPRVAYLMEQHFPFATHGRNRYCEQHAYFDYDNSSYGHLAIEVFAKRGRQHIWMIAPPHNQNYALNMIEGAQQACQVHQLTLHLSQHITSDHSITDVTTEVTRLLQTHPTIDAFVCPSASCAIGVAAAVEAMGKTIGTDIDIVVKEVIPFLKLFRPKILVMQEDVAAAGEWLCKAVLQAIEYPELPPLQKMEVPHWDELKSQL